MCVCVSFSKTLYIPLAQTACPFDFVVRTAMQYIWQGIVLFSVAFVGTTNIPLTEFALLYSRFRKSSESSFVRLQGSYPYIVLLTTALGNNRSSVYISRFHRYWMARLMQNKSVHIRASSLQSDVHLICKLD